MDPPALVYFFFFINTTTQSKNIKGTLLKRKCHWHCDINFFFTPRNP